MCVGCSYGTLVRLGSAWRSAARVCSGRQRIIGLGAPPRWLLTGVLVLHKALQQGWLGSSGPLLSRAVGKAVGKAQMFVSDQLAQCLAVAGNIRVVSCVHQLLAAAEQLSSWRPGQGMPVETSHPILPAPSLCDSARHGYALICPALALPEPLASWVLPLPSFCPQQQASALQLQHKAWVVDSRVLVAWRIGRPPRNPPSCRQEGVLPIRRT